MGDTSSRCVLGRGWNESEIKKRQKNPQIERMAVSPFSIWTTPSLTYSAIDSSLQKFICPSFFGHYSQNPLIYTVLMPTTSSSSSSPVVSTPNRQNSNTPSYTDVEKEKTHKVGYAYVLVSHAENFQQAILTAFIAKVSKKGSKGRKEKQPAGSPKFVFDSSELREWIKRIFFDSFCAT